MIYYNVELIDESDKVENFKFNRIEKKDLDKIIENFKDNSPFLEFVAEEGVIIMKTKSIRGIMYQEYIEKEKTVIQENIEAAEEISKIKLKKTIFNHTGDLK